jgi:hypothetical protein
MAGVSVSTTTGRGSKSPYLQTDAVSLCKLLDEVVELLNADEHSEALKELRSYFGLANRWVCVSCGHAQDTLTFREGCAACGADMHCKVVRTKEVRPIVRVVRNGSARERSWVAPPLAEPPREAEPPRGLVRQLRVRRQTGQQTQGAVMIHADTDGLLDKCHCGAVAGFEESEEVGRLMGVREQHRARCTECCEQTEYRPCKFQALLDWNHARRAEKEKAKA